MSDQPRWPGGTPVRPDGHGPGGGRFRDGGAAWAERLAAAAAARAASGPAGLMTHDQVFSYMDRDDYQVLGTAGGDQGHVEFREYSDGTRLAYKVITEGVPNSAVITPEYAARAEAKTSVVAHAIGAPVPATVVDPDNPAAILMEYIPSRRYPPAFIPGLGAATRVDAVRRARDTPEGRMLSLLDVIVGNPDRHVGNVVINRDGDPIGIDHGLAFSFDRWGGSFETDFGDSPASMTSQFGVRLFKGDGSDEQQWYYSPEAIREAYERVKDIAGQLDPKVWEGIRDALVELEAMSTGTHDLGE